MAINQVFHNYQQSPPPAEVGGRCSPALRQLEVALHSRWQTHQLGCYGPRPISGGTLPSSHSYGAAADVGYDRSTIVDPLPQLCAYLIAWSNEWQIQAVHDYVGCRIWRAGRTRNPADACTTWWRAQRPDGNGMGKAWARWLHIEVTPSGWFDGRSELDRGVV